MVGILIFTVKTKRKPLFQIDYETFIEFIFTTLSNKVNVAIL